MKLDFQIVDGVLEKYLGKQKEVTIPDGVKIIDNEAFRKCTFLEHVIIPESVIKIGKAFSYCQSLKSTNIPRGITEIEFGSFVCCTSLKHITISDSVKKSGHTLLLELNH